MIRIIPRRRPVQVVRVGTANMDFNKGGDRKYVRHLKRRIRRGILGMQERGHGIASVRVRGVGGVGVRNKRTVVLGKVGAHRGVALGEFTLAGRTVTAIVPHGPHLRTVGKAVQRDYYEHLAALCRSLDAQGRLWVVLGDFNRNHEAVARLLGGTSVGHGVDGVIAGPGLAVRLVDVDPTAVLRRWSDHAAVLAELALRDHLEGTP